MRFRIAHILGLLVTADALAVSTIERKSSNAEYQEVTDAIAAPLEARRDIEVIALIVSTGLYTGAIIVGYSTYFATQIKTQSNIKSCSVISGNLDGTNWQYQATTSGTNCDTTAEPKTIENAVQRELKYMVENSVNQACFLMDHGGTWQGQLKIAMGGKPIATDSECRKAKRIPL